MLFVSLHGKKFTTLWRKTLCLYQTELEIEEYDFFDRHRIDLSIDFVKLISFALILFKLPFLKISVL